METQSEKAFFERALGFSKHWSVTSLRLDTIEKKAHIYLEYLPTNYVDEETGEFFDIYDHRPMRKWQHLSVLQYSTYLHCRIPRIKDEQGKVKSIPVPWADCHDSFTYLFSDHIVDLLLASHNQTKTAELAGTTFDIVNRIMNKAVERGLSRRDLGHSVSKLGIDEKAILKGHNYASILVDLTEGRVLDIVQGRDKEAAKSLISNTLNENQLNNIECISMDMWEAFILTAKEKLPNADIVHDKFHLVQYLNDGIDNTRKQEVHQNALLKGAKYVMLKRTENHSVQQSEHFEQIMDTNLLTAKAWALSEQFKDTVLTGSNYIRAIAYFDMWIDTVKQAMIKPMIKVAATFTNHMEGIINYVKHKVTNALVERINGKIQNLKNVGRGYRSFHGLRIAVLFFNAKLDLYSHKSQ